MLKFVTQAPPDNTDSDRDSEKGNGGEAGEGASPASVPGPPRGECAILEILGHRRRVGHVAEVERFGVRLLSVSFLEQGRRVTELYAPSSLFCYTPVTEDYVREYDARHAAPSPYPPQRQLPPPDDDLYFSPEDGGDEDAGEEDAGESGDDYDAGAEERP